MQQGNERFYNNEIDMITPLLRGVLGQKRMILLVTLLSLAIGCLCAWTITPVYEARVYFIPPTDTDIAGLNAGRANFEHYPQPMFTISSVYEVVMKTLLSQATKQDFYKDVFLPSWHGAFFYQSSEDAAYKQFKNVLSINKEHDGLLAQSEEKFYVSVKAHSSAQALDWAKRYVSLVEKNALNSLLRTMNGQNQNVAQSLRRKIEMTREVTQQARKDRLAQLNEALAIANGIGLAVPVGNVTLMYNDPALMYKRGSVALMAEIKHTSARDSDDAFSPGLRELQSEYKLLQQINTNPHGLKVFRLDGSIDTPRAPISQGKRLLFILFLALGLSLGCLIAFVRVFFSRDHANTSHPRAQLYGH